MGSMSVAWPREWCRRSRLTSIKVAGTNASVCHGHGVQLHTMAHEGRKAGTRLKKSASEALEYEEKLKQEAAAKGAIKALFDEIDGNKDSAITSAEFHRAMTGTRSANLRALLATRGKDWQLVMEVLASGQRRYAGQIAFPDFEEAVLSSRTRNYFVG